MSDRAPDRYPPPESYNLADEERKVEETSREVAFLTVAGMRDNLTPEQRENYRRLENSARAELMLRRKGVAWLKRELSARQAAAPPDAPRKPPM